MTKAWEPDVLVVGGGVGGVAAAIAASAGGARVLLIERYEWLGGQLTSQAVPPDEHQWIETRGSSASYRLLRQMVRNRYRRDYPLSRVALSASALNPGNGWVSPLCAEPGVFRSAIDDLIRPWIAAGNLRMQTGAWPVGATVDADRVTGVRVQRLDGGQFDVTPHLILEASETGELLPLTGVEYRTGAESVGQTGEPSARERARPLDMQAVTHSFAVESIEGDHTIDRPADYAHWRKSRPFGWPNTLFDWTYPNPRSGVPVTARFEPNLTSAETDMETGLQRPELWSYRRILDRRMFRSGFLDSDVTVVNWPMTDYVDGPLFDTPDAPSHADAAKRLALSFFYWLQTEAPRSDGGSGFPSLRLRPDVMGTADGFAQAPYVRESRRIVAVTTPTEQDLSVAVRGDHGAVSYHDAVGVGSYRIDLHPSTNGTGYLDIPTLPFEIPLGALLPVRVRNLVAAGKAIGTTHITNGCYRVHPVEWSIGEAAGALAAYCLATGTEPHAVREDAKALKAFQSVLIERGVDLRWSYGARGAA